MVARWFTTFGLISLLISGPLFGLLAAFDTIGGAPVRQYPISGIHAWMVVMGWCVPTTIALVCWLLPILKERPVRYGPYYKFWLMLLVIPTAGQALYLFMADHGSPPLFILPPIWFCYLAAAVLYLLFVRQIIGYSLRPTAGDVGLKAGAVWLLIIMFLRFVIALGATITTRPNFLIASEPAFLIALVLGFLGNTVLVLAEAVAPEFLQIPHSRASVITSFRIYNTAVAIWCAGAAWILSYPFSWGRLVFAAVGFFLAYAIVQLLVSLRLMLLLATQVSGRRRQLTRTTLGTAAILMTLAAGFLVLIGLWAIGTVQVPPRALIVLPLHLLCFGFFTNMVLALFIPVLGATSLDGPKASLASGAYVFMLLWLLMQVTLTIIGLTNGTEMWSPRYHIWGFNAIACILLTAWLVWAISDREQLPTPPAG